MKRTKLAQQYADDNKSCELHKLLGYNLQHIDKGQSYLRGVLGKPPEWWTLDVHHIFGGSKGRTDNTTNLILVLHPIHNTFCHPHNSRAQLICTWKKMDKGELDFTRQPDDGGEFKAASGKYLEGWLAMNEPKEKWVHKYWRELVNFEKGAA